MARVAVLAPLLFCVSMLSITHAQPARSTTRRVVCAEKDRPNCAFDVNGRRFELNNQALFIQRAAGGGVGQTQISFRPGAEVERVFYAEVGRDLVVVYEVDGGEHGGGGVFRIDPARMSLKWQVTVPAFNLSVGTIEGDRLYEAGIGFVSAIDLTAGTFVWKHNGLYDRARFAFNSFERPEVLNQEVHFTEHVDGGSTRAPETIRVDKATGRIVK